MASILLEKGAPHSCVGANATAPLHLACEQGYQTIVTQLLKAKSDPELCDGDGDTALHLAACGTNGRGHESVVRVLLQHGACARTKRRNGMTAARTTKDKQLRELLEQSE